MTDSNPITTVPDTSGKSIVDAAISALPSDVNDWTELQKLNVTISAKGYSCVQNGIWYELYLRGQFCKAFRTKAGVQQYVSIQPYGKTRPY